MEENTLEESALAQDSQVALKPDYESEIKEIIRSNVSPRVMCEKLEDYHDNDIAEVLPDLTSAERKRLYRVLKVSVLSGIFEYMEKEQVGVCLDEMDLKKAAAVISDMESDAAVEFLRGLEKEKRALLIDLLDEDARQDLALIASFDEDEIGSRMSTNYISQ